MASKNDSNGDGDGDSENSHHPPYLPPSELGTKEYWETFYKRSLEYIASRRNQSTATTTRPADDGAGHGEDVDADMDVDVDDDDDPGTSWFAEHKAPEKVLQFLTSRKFPLSPRNTIPSTRRQQSQQQQNQQDEQRQPSILDLGTGNGSMLALLRKKGGFKGPMVGVDYSPQSVQLARELQRLRLHSAYESGMESESEEVASSYGGDSDEGNPDDEEHEELVAADNVGAAQAVRVSEEIRFEEWDILASGNEEALAATTTKTSSPAGVKRIDWFPYETGGFDIVLDKGTFDAVSLSADVIDDDDDDKKEKEEEEKKGPKRIQRRVCERYPRIATKLVRKGGFLVVTSCNWTEEELIRWFTDSKTGEDGLDVYDRIEYPRFRFGGREGQGVCTIDIDVDMDIDE